MDDIRPERGNTVPQALVVMTFEMTKLFKAQPGVTEIAMDSQRTLHMGLVFRLWVFIKTVIARKHLNIVASISQGLGDGFTAQFISTDVKRRVEIGKN
jgi:hypothetical protein